VQAHRQRAADRNLPRCHPRLRAFTCSQCGPAGIVRLCADVHRPSRPHLRRRGDPARAATPGPELLVRARAAGAGTASLDWAGRQCTQHSRRVARPSATQRRGARAKVGCRDGDPVGRRARRIHTPGECAGRRKRGLLLPQPHRIEKRLEQNSRSLPLLLSRPAPRPCRETKPR